MKTTVSAAMLLGMVCICSGAVVAAEQEPTVYVIQKGDTLWGLSDKFLNDPHYWPDLWSRNPIVTNPHFIYPGDKVRVYPDRIEVVPAEAAKPASVPPPPVAAEQPVEEVAKERSFVVSGSEGFLLEDALKPAGFIISTYQNREIVGEDDIVYADIGKTNGAKPGDRYAIYKKTGAISHPVSNFILGQKVIPLGTLQLSQVEEKVSKAIITKSYQEIGAGSFLLPYRERRREVALKASNRELQGYIVETQAGNTILGAGDIAFLDLGKRQGAEVGNMLYVVRDPELDQKFIDTDVGKLPEELIGALVVVDVGENTSTALIIKSIDTIYRGDRVELKKGK
ncbi:MAG TPA: LysM domain-containing protein [Geobacteraceae bacterium]